MRVAADPWGNSHLWEGGGEERRATERLRQADRETDRKITWTDSSHQNRKNKSCRMWATKEPSNIWTDMMGRKNEEEMMKTSQNNTCCLLVWWYRPVILALERLRQADCSNPMPSWDWWVPEILGFDERHCLKEANTDSKRTYSSVHNIKPKGFWQKIIHLLLTSCMHP